MKTEKTEKRNTFFCKIKHIYLQTNKGEGKLFHGPRATDTNIDTNTDTDTSVGSKDETKIKKKNNIHNIIIDSWFFSVAFTLTKQQINETDGG